MIVGSFEECVLLAVARLGANAYGITIRTVLADATGQPPSIGAVYATIERLTAKGLVASHQGEPTPKRGGRAKTLVALSDAGRQALSEAERVRARLRG